ncbi:MAG: DUF58 domain-containing protein [Candidatus Hydrogenedens sp.]|jgi:uncharacterized protein (DUF58 family)|nr:DUF58 domain-containing protein [Candidatus Hydrogenedens sp.]
MTARYWKRTLLITGCSLGLIALAFAINSPHLAYSVYAFLILLALAWVSTALWFPGLESERTVNRMQVQQGEDVEVVLEVKNSRGLPVPWLYVEDPCSASFPVRGRSKGLGMLMPRQSMTLKYTLTCTRRGYHRIGPALLETGDLFGLHKRFRSDVRRDYISVLPTIAYIDTYSISSRRPQGPVRITNRMYADPTRINNLREYQPGDPLNSIHWKATARTSELHVKTFEATAVTGGTLILDLHEDSYLEEKRESRMELAITTTASIAYLLQMSGEQVGLLTNGRDAAEAALYESDVVEARSRDELEELRLLEMDVTRMNPLSVPTQRGVDQAIRIAENLARVLPGQALDLPALLNTQCTGLPRDATLLPVTGQVTDRLALSLGLLKQSGFQVTVFLIDAGTHYEDAAKLLGEYNIHVFHIEHERDLHELSPAKI